MRSFAFALMILGGVMAYAPAYAIDNAMPEPEMPPPVTDYAPPPVTDETLPRAAAPDTEMPPAPAEAPAAPSNLPVPARTEMVPPADYAAAPPTVCNNCPPPRRYDSQEVIKRIREIDRSRTINTTEMAPDYAPPQPTPGYRVRSDVTLVNFVVHRYRVIYAPELVPASEANLYRPVYSGDEYRPKYRPHRAHVACRYGKRGRYGSCRPLLRVRG